MDDFMDDFVDESPTDESAYSWIDLSIRLWFESKDALYDALYGALYDLWLKR